MNLLLTYYKFIIKYLANFFTSLLSTRENELKYIYNAKIEDINYIYRGYRGKKIGTKIYNNLL